MWTISALFVVLVLKYPVFCLPTLLRLQAAESEYCFFLFSKIVLEFVSSEKQ